MPPKEHNASIPECENEETEELIDTEFKKLSIRVLTSSQKQLHEVTEFIQDVKEKFSQDMRILNKNQNEILEMLNKTKPEMLNSIERLTNLVEILNNRIRKAEERISNLEDKLQKILRSDKKQEEI